MVSTENACIKGIFLCIIILFGVFFSCDHFYNLQIKTILEDIKGTGTRETKYILYWSPFMNNAWDYKWGYGHAPFEGCEYKECFTTKNRTFMPLEKFDALLFHAAYSATQRQYGAPHVRSPHQIYIYLNLESPRWTNWKLDSFKSFFNWTMTYRLDSDVIDSYGYIYKEKTNFSMLPKEQLKNKTGAAWFVSHCGTDSRREILVRELQKFYKVDVYGRCGNLTCPRSISDKCYKMIEQTYKFYLSFENSYCKDYVTEKLFNILQRNIVPVVYSAGVGKDVVPREFIINVDDFQNVSHLADYLRYLDDNVDEYAKYLEWKKDFYIHRDHKVAACRLCKKLHQPLEHNVYEDISNWWFGKNHTMCKKRKELPKIVSDLLK